ncbi:hypothetical protein [Neobacillus sp. SAB-20_R2A]|uniref:hypothetical protein n=1 Tax=Neobacillus sp. SAB-20_R2A TaxID=3120519 RepID=UPI003C6E2AF6
MNNTYELQNKYFNDIELKYPISKKITPTMIYRKRREIEDRIRDLYPRQYESREIYYPKIYSTWGIPVENFDVEYPDYNSLKINPFEDKNNETEYEYSDVLYWESVHDGDIKPDDETNYVSFDDYCMDYGDYSLKEKKDLTLQTIQFILSSNLPDEIKAKALVHIAGVGIEKYDDIANSKIKEIVRLNMQEIGERKNLRVNNSAYKVWLEDISENRFLSIHMGAYPSDLFYEKQIEFYEAVTKEKMQYAILLLKLTGYEIKSSVQELLLSDEFISSDSWSNFKEREKFAAIENFFYINLSSNILTVNQGGMSGVQGY